MVALLVEILYWSMLLLWSIVVTYVVLFVFFPEKPLHADHSSDTPAASPKFARHRFQQLPGNAELTVNDIVVALQHLPKDSPATEAVEEHQDTIPHEEPQVDIAPVTKVQEETEEH